jgi:hypothetical protein
MPVDYSPLMGGTADLGNALVRAEQVKGIRQQNALAQRQMAALDQQDQSRAALNSILAQNPGAGVNELVRGGVDPFTAQQYASQQGQLAAQDTEQDARTFALRQAKFAQLDPMLAQIEKSQDPVAMAKYLLPKAQEMGFFPDSMPVGDDPEAILQGVKRFRALAQAVMAPPEPAKLPNSYQEYALASQDPAYQAYLDSRRAQNGMGVEVLPDGTVRMATGGLPLGDVAGRVPAGYRYRDPDNPMAGVEPIPGGPATKADSATEGERKAAVYVNSMQSAEQSIEGLGEYRPSAYDQQLFGILLSDEAGGAVKAAANKALSPKAQKFLQAGTQWVDNLGRLKTGAAFPKNEVVRYMTSYLPMAGDDPETVAQKRQARATEYGGAGIAAGRLKPEPPNIILDENGTPVREGAGVIDFAALPKAR